MPAQPYRQPLAHLMRHGRICHQGSRQHQQGDGAVLVFFHLLPAVRQPPTQLGDDLPRRAAPLIHLQELNWAACRMQHQAG